MVGQLRIFAAILAELRHPGVTLAMAALPHQFLKALVYPVRHQELRVFRPAINAFREPDFFLAQRLAVRGAGVLLVRSAIGDMAVDDNERRPVLWVSEKLERPLLPF